MFSIGNFFLGILFVVLGTLGVKYTFQIRNFTGSQDWIERYLGGGSTYLVYKLFFLAIVIFGILLAIGLVGNIFGPAFAPLKQAFGNGV